MSVSKNSSIACIKLYQRLEFFLNPLFWSVFGFHSQCKYIPTCSEYTILQIRRYGTITGIRKGLRRVASCK